MLWSSTIRIVTGLGEHAECGTASTAVCTALLPHDNTEASATLADEMTGMEGDTVAVEVATDKGSGSDNCGGTRESVCCGNEAGERADSAVESV